MIRNILKFLWRCDSESAHLLAVALARHYLNRKHRHELAQRCDELNEIDISNEMLSQLKAVNSLPERPA